MKIKKQIFSAIAMLTLTTVMMAASQQKVTFSSAYTHTSVVESYDSIGVELDGQTITTGTTHTYKFWGIDGYPHIEFDVNSCSVGTLSYATLSWRYPNNPAAVVGTDTIYAGKGVNRALSPVCYVTIAAPAGTTVVTANLTFRRATDFQYYSAKRLSESVSTVSTTAKKVTLSSSGILVIAPLGKIFVHLDPAGVNANRSDIYVSDGGLLDTGLYYNSGDKFSILGDSGTVTVNVKVYNR
jgi:hypothetical protein